MEVCRQMLTFIPRGGGGIVRLAMKESMSSAFSSQFIPGGKREMGGYDEILDLIIK